MEIQGMDGSVVADDAGITFHFNKFVAHPDKKSVSPNHIPWSKVSSISFTQPGKYSTAVLKVHVVDESIGHIKPKQDPNALLGNVGKQADDLRLFAEQFSMRLAGRTGGAAQIVPTPTGSQRKTVRDAGSQIGVKFGARRELRKLHKHLMPGEQVRYVAGGQVSRRRGIIALTDHRFLVLFQGMTRNSIEDLPLDRITSIREKSGLLLGTLTVVASNTQMVVSEISKVDMKRLSVALRLRISTGALPPLPAVSLSAVDDDMEQDASPVNGSTSDGRTKLLEQLEHLGRLKDAGVLGADEFEDAKAKLMNDF